MKLPVSNKRGIKMKNILSLIVALVLLMSLADAKAKELKEACEKQVKTL